MSQKKAEDKKKGQAWRKFALFLLFVQIILSVSAVYVVYSTKMVPQLYLILLGIGMLFLCILVFALAVMPKKRKGKSKGSVYLKRALGSFIAVFTMVLCVMGISVCSKMNQTIDRITTDQTVVTDVMGVYVLADDPAQQLQDVAGYQLGLTTSFDYDDSVLTVQQIRTTLGTELDYTEYETVFEMVDALYEGEEIQAFILNEAYESVISDMEGYEQFSENTRIIYEYELETVVEPGAEENVEEPLDVSSNVFTVYISGSDTRSKKLTTSRSDVNIIAVINPDTRQVLLLSTPRDYYIPISISSNGTCDKLTHCALYGIDCSMNTLENLYDMKLDYYGQINFSGFETLIDAIGGVTVESEKSFTTTHGGYQISKGTNNLNGAQALGFVRERYAFSDGDLARGRNEMRVISAVISKMTSATTLLTNYSAIMDSLEGMFVTNMSSDDISTLVRMQLADMRSWDVRTYYVSGSNANKTTYSMPKDSNYVMIPDESMVEKAKQLIEKMESGEVLTDADFPQ